MDPKLLQQIEEDRQVDGTFGEHYRSAPEAELDLGIPTLAEEAERTAKATLETPASAIPPQRTSNDALEVSLASLRTMRYTQYRMNVKQLLRSFVPPHRLVRNLRQWRGDSLSRRKEIRDAYRDVRALRASATR